MTNDNRSASGTVAAEEVPYLPGLSYSRYLAYMRRFPRFLPVLPEDPASLAPVMPALTKGNEFDTDLDGRGDSYRAAQRRAEVRLVGIRALLELALGGPVPRRSPPGLRVLDVLGGDGTLARALPTLCPDAVGDRQWILTGDLSRPMVAQAVRYGLPAVCQPAQHLLVADGTFDAVVIAYGTHHIPAAERKTVYAEALRVLRPGGRVVVHDFDESGGVADWFTHVVHKYAPNGHPYEHFSPGQLADDLHSVGFRAVSVREVHDPFVFRAPSPDGARQRLCEYVADMYGLFGLRREPAWQARLWELIHTHLRRPAQVRPAGDGRGFQAVMSRDALVGVGTK